MSQRGLSLVFSQLKKKGVQSNGKEEIQEFFLMGMVEDVRIRPSMGLCVMW